MKQTILVLDDDPDILDEITEALMDEGFDVLAVSTGAELWVAADKQPIVLFILDLMLKGESGLTIAKEIRGKSDVGIVIVTGNSGEADRVLGLELGADDYVTKPFSPLELLARVRSVLRRTKGSSYPGRVHKPAGQAIVEFCGFKLDVDAYHLTDLEGKPIPLTTAEFELLKSFIDSPNQVLSRDYLLDSIHGREWTGYDRGVDGLVSRLRRKIKPPDGNPLLIKTIRGTGYMFTASVLKHFNNEADQAMQLNQTFRKFVPKQFVDHLMKHGSNTLELGRADEDELAILFSDIRGFSSLSEKMKPQELMNFLNSYFLRMNKPIHDNYGFIDKFIGDGVMALFDRPTGSNIDKAQDSIRAALGLRYAINLYNQHRANCNYLPINIGIGIHFGPVIIGTVGSDDRMDTTVIGDSVNIACKLEALAPKYGTDIITSAQTLAQAQAKGLFEYRLLDWVRVKGRKKPIEIYEIIDHQDADLKQLKLSNAILIEQGLTYRKEQKWELALSAFQQALAIYPKDILALHHLEQCAKLENIELAQDWDGSILL
jgi:adenylate cyclase